MKTHWYRNSTVIGAIICGICTIIAAVILVWPQLPPPPPSPSKPADFALLIGSGTVNNYLWQVAPKLLSSNKVHVLEGATTTGIRILSEAYLHGEIEDGWTFPILAMASKKLEKKDFIPYDENGGFFEVHIGNDVLQATFGAPTKKAFDAAFRNAEKSLFDMIITRNGKECITISDLSYWVWSTSSKDWESKERKPGYIVYLTYIDSATRSIFEEKLRALANQSPKQDGWPIDYRPFKLQAKDLIESKIPWIALGSQVINDEDRRLLQSSNKIKILTLLDINGQPIQRGLFIYGRMPKQESNINENRKGFMLRKRICLFLNDLFSEFENNLEGLSISGNVILEQKAYFNLKKDDKTFGWIRRHLGGHSQIYRYKESE